MNKVFIFFVWLACCFGMPVAVNSQAPGPFSAGLDGTVSIDTISIPMPLENGHPLKLSLASPRPYTVKSGGNLLGEQYTRAFNIYLDEKGFPTIGIVVDMRLLAKAGTYELAVVVKKTDSTLETITVTLLRPAPVLDTISTAQVTIDGCTPSYSTALVLKETSKLANISGLVVHPPYFNICNDSTLIAIDKRPVNLPAGTALEFIYHLNNTSIDKLPLGKSIGFAQVTSPNLQTPLVIPFEIINKRSSWWIVVAIVLGLITGLVVRHYLADKKQWEQQRMNGFICIENIQKEVAQIQDKPYRDAVAQLLLGLNALLEKAGGAAYFTGVADPDIAAKIQEVTTAYNGLKAGLEQRLKDLDGQLKKIAGCFENDPPDSLMTRKLAAAGLSYKFVLERMEAFDPTAAEPSLAKTISGIREAIGDIKSYLLSVQQLFSKDESYPASMPQQLKTTIKTTTGTIMGSLSELKDDPNDLQQLTANVTVLRKMSGKLTALMNFYGESLDKAYKLPANKNNPAVVKFVQILAAWKTKLSDIATNAAGSPDAATYFDASFVRQIEQQWAEVLKVEDPAFGSEAVSPDTYSYTAVATGGQQPAVPATNIFDSNSPFWQQISAETTVTRKKLIFYGLLQTIILAVILCAIAYNTYGPGFIGTFNELLVYFLFAFSIDITVDTVLKYKGGKVV
ncbi:hypothetical protein [Chitinophaga eiseniae]|uniref:Uncharacterized protein n=1 Tax=Chitinophaga eiseniae TaxID=634771 RepID=A0A847S5B3_9BACT|nr:hypothetical protein [Chitinophaga eiseniae]NLR78450.1 hypothetical protein [Chitinophaga eiseniae]